MKITFVTPAPDLSGGQRVVAIYADRLLKKGHDVTVVARGRAVPSLKEKLRYLVRGKQRAAQSNESHFDTMQARLIVLPHSEPISAADLPDGDIVIATWWETAFEVAHLPSSKGSKFYFVQHHEVHSHLPRHISGGSYFLPLKKITISSWLVDIMRTQYADANVKLVHNSVDHELFFAPERGRQSVPTVGLLYAPAHFKGVDVALKAIEIARRTHPNLRLVVFGAHRPTEHLPITTGAEFYMKPPQASLRDIYASCDVWLCGSRSEGFHLPPAEAMACRCPVVSTRVGGPADMILDGKNGFLVDVDDAEALGARLTEVLSMDGSKWREMSDAAHQTTLSYTWDNATEILESHLLESDHIYSRR